MSTIASQIGDIENIDLMSVYNADYEYHKLLLNILVKGVWKDNRTGIKTLSLFGPQLTFKNIENKFPLITTKKIHWKSVVGELLWFLTGNTNKFVLKEKYGCSIWDEWGDNLTGELGPVYGKQWVAWKDYKTRWVDAISGPGMTMSIYINQIQNIINKLKINPDDRRLIVSAWNVADIEDMALPPCHYIFQLYSALYPKEQKRRLSLKMNMRSTDMFLGAPFNIASYALLLMLIAKEVDMIPQDLIISFGDAHIYENHFEYIKEQLTRGTTSIPYVTLTPLNKSIWDITMEDISLQKYNAHPNWKNIPVAV